MKLRKLSITLFALVFIIGTSQVFAQNEPDSTSHKHNMMGKENKHMMDMKDTTMHKMMKDHKMDDMHGMKKDSMHKGGMHGKMSDSVVREGVIDLQSIDKNKDGKVFQDVMDWNVISDEAGKCPICEMKLKEVSIEEAKTNLLKNGFKVKE